jgi:hypothetical protein
MADFNTKATIGAVPNPILARKSDPLHILQMVKNLKHKPITGVTDEELLYRARNLAQLEAFGGFIPIRKGSKAPLVSSWGKEYLSLEKALSYDPAALAVFSPYFLVLDYDAESALDFVAARGIDFTLSTWHTRRTDNLWRFKQKFLVTDEMLDELPERQIKRETHLFSDVGLDVFCSKMSYIIIDGEHEDGEGRYYSPGGLDVCDLQPPPKEVWDLIKEIAEFQEVEKSSTKTYSNTKSKKLYPCPICGRNKNHWCFENDNGLIHCMNGQTFSAERKHGPLKIGDVVDGYALVAQISTCNTFKIHNPISKRIYNPRPLNRPLNRRQSSAKR